MGTTNLEDFKKKYMPQSSNNYFDTSLNQHPLFDFMNSSSNRRTQNSYNNILGMGINNLSYDDCFNHHL